MEVFGRTFFPVLGKFFASEPPSITACAYAPVNKLPCTSESPKASAEA